MNPRSEGGTVSSAPSTSGEVTRLMLGYLFPSRDTRGESRLSLWTQKHGDEDELTDGTGDCWAGGGPRDSVSDDDHGTASYKPETLQVRVLPLSSFSNRSDVPVAKAYVYTYIIPE